MLITQYTRFGYVEGLGDEEIPWWIAPYVRDFVALAKSTAVLENLTAKPETALASLTRRVAETAGVARVAAHVKGNEALNAGISGALAADLDEFCGTPPRPHRLDQAALIASLIASSLQANDPAKAVLVAQVERLQNLRGQSVSAAA
ncbi:MAG TPA: hypothetical protein VJW20_05970 [Candidatus Angelobacter sp.]|nr:hypothetical protein [Candidatus Angelobacter sp.]